MQSSTQSPATGPFREDRLVLELVIDTGSCQQFNWLLWNFKE